MILLYIMFMFLNYFIFLFFWPIKGLYDMLKGKCHFNKHSYLILLKQSWNRYKIQNLDAMAGRYKEKKMLVFWPHSVFGQNHLYVRMLQTGIPLFRVKSEEFQSSLSAVRTICHPVRTPICLLFHPSGRRVFPSGRMEQ
jgi:hypothetical protein